MSAPKIRPLGNYVLVQPDPTDEFTPGGIALPEALREKPRQGVVVSAGPGKSTENGPLVPTTLKTGDRVVFTIYAGTEVHVGGVHYLLMCEDEILGAVEDRLDTTGIVDELSAKAYGADAGGH